MTVSLPDIAPFRGYADARRDFLRSLGCDGSCRDPLSEFSERLVCQLLGGTLASSRVQKGHDLVTPDGRRVQVKYLANPVGAWRNGHTVQFADAIDDYAVVFFEGLELKAVLVFRRETIREVCTSLKKRHPNQDRELQLTQADYRKLAAAGGSASGVIVYDLASSSELRLSEPGPSSRVT